jgi:hypothetical protein
MQFVEIKDGRLTVYQTVLELQKEIPDIQSTAGRLRS